MLSPNILTYIVACSVNHNTEPHKSYATVSLKRDCKNDLIFDLNMNEEYAIKTVSLITGNFGINNI